MHILRQMFNTEEVKMQQSLALSIQTTSLNSGGDAEMPLCSLDPPVMLSKY